MEVTRRTVLAGGAAGLLGGALPAAQNHHAAAAGDRLTGIGAAPRRAVDPDTGLASLVISMFEFVPYSAANELIISTPGAYSAFSGTFAAPVRLPVGAALEAVTIAARVRTSGAASQLRPGLQAVGLTFGRGNIGLDLTFTASNDIQLETAERTWFVAPDNQLYVTVSLNGTTDSQIIGARIDYTPAPGPVGFTPVVPYRAYDSRLDMSPDANGRIATGDNRTVSVASARDIVSGAVTTADVIPAHATAVAYNVTIAESQGAGFLSLTPGDAIELGTSAINWGSGTADALANAGVVQLDDQRRIKMFAGGDGSTHAIVDITGYFSA